MLGVDEDVRPVNVAEEDSAGGGVPRNEDPPLPTVEVVVAVWAAGVVGVGDLAWLKTALKPTGGDWPPALPVEILFAVPPLLFDEVGVAGIEDGDEADVGLPIDVPLHPSWVKVV